MTTAVSQSAGGEKVKLKANNVLGPFVLSVGTLANSARQMPHLSAQHHSFTRSVSCWLSLHFFPPEE